MIKMQEIACKMCGSNDVVKEGDLYICQNCGTKYSQSEAKDMRVDKIVHLDDSIDVNNLVVLLDRSIEDEDWEEVYTFSIEILERDPDNWKAIFFKELSQAWNGNPNEINSFNSIMTASDIAIKKVEKEGTEDISETKNYIANQMLKFSSTLVNVTDENHERSQQMVYFYWDALLFAIKINEYCVDLVYENEVYNLYDNIVKYASELEVRRLYDTPEFYESLEPIEDVKDYAKDVKETYLKKIKEIDPNYQQEEVGDDTCYIATSVYGSCMSNEVMTLRRFRDNTLYNYFFGRLFIIIYYATSPYLVRYFRNNRIFNKIFRNLLDFIVKKLQSTEIGK